MAKTIKNPDTEGKREESRKLQIAYNLDRYISGYSVDIDLSDLRKSFEARASTGNAQYFERDEYAAASDIFAVSTEQGQYRLSVQLKKGDDLTFHLTPGLQKPLGTNLQSGHIKRFVNGVRLASSDGTAIDRPFNGSLEVTVNASLLPSGLYTVTLYKLHET